MKFFVKYVFLLLLAVLLSSNLYSQLYINEISAANVSYNIDTYYYNYSDWIEIYNGGATSVTISNFYLTDDETNLRKWQFPNRTVSSKGVFIVWCDDMNTGLHTNFGIDVKGEKLILSDGVNIIDQINYPEQFTNYSYGRVPNGGAKWSYFTKPTPIAANSTESVTKQTNKPKFSVANGFYDGTTSVTLSANPNATIRYTTDGSEPLNTSTLYTKTISLSTTTVVKAVAFEIGFLPSKIVASTYFISEHHSDLPVVSLSTKAENLNDNTIGMYVDGTNGLTGNCSDTPKNWNRDWERPFHVEYFDKNKACVINAYAGLKMFGGCSRGFESKSFSVYCRADYGYNDIDYKLFENKNATTFKRFLLRNSGNDWNRTMFRDAMLQDVMRKTMNIDLQGYQPSVVYINGEYWGILNTREKLDEYYIEQNFGYDHDKIDFLQLGWSVDGINPSFDPLAGSTKHFDAMHSYIRSHNMANATYFSYVETQMEIDEYIDYQIAQIYVANTDWPGNNTKLWRPQSADGRWRWIIFDTDFGFGLYNNAPSHNTIEFALATGGTGWPNPDWSTYMLRKLLESPTFKEKFIQRFAFHINTTFDPAKVNASIDSIKALIEPEMPYHFSRWGSNLSSWNSEINVMRNFANQRPNYIRQHIAKQFGLPGTFTLTLTNHNDSAGTAYISGCMVKEPIYTGVFFAGIPIQLTASPNPGYKFKCWNIETNRITNEPLFNFGETWKYNDKGVLPATNWKDSTYNDAIWASGQGKFGYGNDGETTTVNYGDNTGNKHITTYFRKKVFIRNLDSIATITGELIRDDGVVIFVNGVEAARVNMAPNIKINYNVVAVTAISGIDETTPVFLQLSKNLFVEGNNYIAVEVHQNSGNSSDLGFDLKISVNRVRPLTKIKHYFTQLTDTFRGDVVFSLEFEKEESITKISINEVLADNKDILSDENGEYDDWFELYNHGNDTVDIAGFYVSDDFDNLQKYQIPNINSSKLKIAPRKHLVIWADADTDQGPNHVAFKLEKSGEQLTVSQTINDKMYLLDSLSFAQQQTDVSYGRYPDGDANLIAMRFATPNAPNLSYINDIPATLQDIVSVYPNPTHGLVYISGIAPTSAITITDISGKKIANYEARQEIDLSSLKQGVYFIIIDNKVFKIMKY